MPSPAFRPLAEQFDFPVSQYRPSSSPHSMTSRTAGPAAGRCTHKGLAGIQVRDDFGIELGVHAPVDAEVLHGRGWRIRDHSCVHLLS